MPRKRIRTTTKANWSLQTLQSAIKIIQAGQKSIRRVALETGIPYSTLKKRVKLQSNISSQPVPRLGRKPVFSDDQEKKLCEHLISMSNIFYGLDAIQFRKIAFACAETIKIDHNFNRETKMAGPDWLEGFLKRNPMISVRKPEATSIHRIQGFNKEEVDRFFNNLEIVFGKYKFEPSQIYNVDETGISTVQEPEKILAKKGQKRVGSITSWEKGKTITVICAMSATGAYIPPLFIFPRQRHSTLLEKDGPPRAAYECSHNGWTNEEIFLKWLRHFIKHANPTVDRPALLVMDNHNSHATLNAFNLCKENNIVMLSIPPHTSHRLQPLDVTFFGPLKKAYYRECDLHMKSHNLVKLTPYDVAALFQKAYSRVAAIDKGISGFKTTGIFPINANIFSDDDFIIVDQQNSITDANMNPTDQAEPVQIETTDAEASVPQDISSVLKVLSPLPTLTSNQNKQRTCSKKQHSEILTHTPLKAVYEEKMRKRKEKENQNKPGTSTCSKIKRIKTEKKKETKEKKSKGRKSKGKRFLFRDETSSEESSLDEPGILCNDDSDDDSGDENKCMICLDVGKSNELWYRCRSCGNWAHADCTDSDNAANYICDFCVQH